MVHPTPSSCDQGAEARSLSFVTDLSNEVLHSHSRLCPQSTPLETSSTPAGCPSLPLTGKLSSGYALLTGPWSAQACSAGGGELAKTQHQATCMGTQREPCTYALLQGHSCDFGLLGTLPNGLTSQEARRGQAGSKKGVTGRGAQERQPKPEREIGSDR